MTTDWSSKLTAVPVDEDLPYGVLRFWYPTLAVEHLNPEDYAVAIDPNASAVQKPVTKPTRRRTIRTKR